MKNKVDLVNRLKKLLQDEDVIVHITRSSLNELTSVGEKTREAVRFANEFCRIIEDGNCHGETAADKLTEFLRKFIGH
jgi:rRNA-processing protein FCF1